MKYCVYGTDGGIIKTGFAPVVAHDLIREEAEGRVLFLTADEKIDDRTHFVDPVNKTVHRIPDRPTQWHAWVQSDRLWHGDVGAVYAARRAEVEAERDRRLQAPIAHDGCAVDADTRAQGNIRDKLQVIAQHEAAGTTLEPVDCVWRDADNVMRQFEAMPSYKDWLTRLNMAVEARNTAAMRWSWARKEALDRITEFDAVLAFDPLEQ